MSTRVRGSVLYRRSLPEIGFFLHIRWQSCELIIALEILFVLPSRGFDMALSQSAIYGGTSPHLPPARPVKAALAQSHFLCYSTPCNYSETKHKVVSHRRCFYVMTKIRERPEYQKWKADLRSTSKKQSLTRP